MRKEGFMKIPGLFAKAEMDRLRAATFDLLLHIGPDRKYAEGGRMQWHNGFPALLFWPRLVHDAFDDITVDDRLQRVVRDELGEEVKQLNNQLYFRLPGDGDAFDWHQDMAFRKKVKPGIENGYLQTMVCIDPMTKDNGCLWFVPDGQVAPGKPERTPPQVLPPGMGAEAVEAESGDLLAWTATVMHGSYSNNSNQSRMTYMNGFAQTDCCDAWPWYLAGGRLQPANPDLIPYT